MCVCVCVCQSTYLGAVYSLIYIVCRDNIHFLCLLF